MLFWWILGVFLEFGCFFLNLVVFDFVDFDSFLGLVNFGYFWFWEFWFCDFGFLGFSGIFCLWYFPEFFDFDFWSCGVWGWYKTKNFGDFGKLFCYRFVAWCVFVLCLDFWVCFAFVCWLSLLICLWFCGKLVLEIFLL